VKRLLATVDGSEFSLSVLGPLRQLAEGLGAHVTLLTVLKPVSGIPEGPTAEARDLTPAGGPLSTATVLPEAVVPGVGSLPPGITDPTTIAPGPLPALAARWAESPHQAAESVEAEARDELSNLAAPLVEAGIEVEVTVLTNSQPAKAIIQFATDGGFDLIAMATHGRTGLGHLVHGSVAGDVLRSGIAPVLMVRPVKPS
jgi:nucleotide-binding universal stress UspA family protein